MTSPEIIVVAEEVDALSGVFVAFCRTRGVFSKRHTLEEFTSRLSIVVSQDSVEVAPEASMFLRWLKWIEPGADHDDRFHRSERFAAAWSAAALTKSRVVNRPDEWGWGARAPFSGALLELRCLEACVAPEIFWSGPHPEGVSEMLHQDMTAGYRRSFSQDLHGFVRSRAMPPCLGWDQVVVVGERAFRVTAVDHGPYDLESASIPIAQKLGLTFTIVSWGIRRDGAAPVLARVNPFPTIYEVAPVWNDVRNSLLDFLLMT